MNRYLKTTVIVVISTVTMTGVAHAAGTGMPWESTLTQVLNSITGPVLRALIILAVVGAGIGFAFTEGGTMLRRAISAVFGLSIAAAAVSWGVTFFGFAGGASF